MLEPVEVEKHPCQLNRLSIALGSTLACASVQAATITVTTLEDAPAGAMEAECNLRDALIAAVYYDDYGGCSVVPDAYGGGNADEIFIEFDSDLSGTLNLAYGELFYPAQGRHLHIVGPGPDNLTIDAGDDSRVLVAAYGLEPAHVTLSGLTFSGGSSTSWGGAILARPANYLRVEDCLVKDSYAGFRGGGIYFLGETLSGDEQLRLKIIDSVITGNATGTDEGGGVFFHAGAFLSLNDEVPRSVYVDIRDSVISYNQAGQSGLANGGGVHATLQIGFGFDSLASVNVEGSQFEGNEASRSAAAMDFSLEVYDSVDSSAELAIIDTLVENHYARDDGGAIRAILESDDSVAGNISALIADSHFIDNESDEFGGALHLEMESDGSSDDVVLAEITGSSFQSNQAAGYGGAVYLATCGDASDVAWQAIYLSENHFESNSAGETGGAAFLYACQFDNVYYASGSADIQAALTDNHFLSNSAGWDGGAVYLAVESDRNYELDIGLLSIDNLFESNQAGDSGGGLFAGFGAVNGVPPGTLTTRFDGDRFIANTSGESGGGLYLVGESVGLFGHPGRQDVEMVNTHLADNAAVWGGGAYLRFEDAVDTGLVMESVTVSGNSASNAAGGIKAFRTEDFRMINSTISGNEAASSGGLRFYGLGDAHLEHATIAFNQSNGYGGGIGVDASDSVLLDHTIVADNSVSGVSDDLYGATFHSFYSLIGSDAGNVVDLGGSLIAVESGLRPLAFQGGPTPTHPVFPGTPPHNAGNPDFTGPPNYDQRGPGFPRVEDGRINIGAVESLGDLVFSDRFEDNEDLASQ